MTRARERFEDILSVTSTWNPRAGSHHSRSLSRGSIRSKTSSARARDLQIDRQEQMINLEADKAKQAKLRKAEILESKAQESSIQLEKAKRDAEQENTLLLEKN